MYNNTMNKKNAILFSTNHHSYLKMLKYALMTLPKVNYETFDIILNINNAVSESKEFDEIRNLLIEKGATTVFYENELEGIHPILRWLAFPVFKKYEHILNLDVDILIMPNTDFNYLIESTKGSDKLFFGVKEAITGKGKIRESVNRIEEMSPNFPEIKEPYNEKFINSGVVLIKNNEFHKAFAEYSKNYETILREYTYLCDKNELNHTDQNFIYFNFNGCLEYIENDWNVRFSHKNNIALAKQDYGVLHYCIKVFLFSKWKLVKIPYISYLEESVENRKWEIFYKRNYIALLRCKPNLWFPFRSFTKIGKRDKNVSLNLKRMSKEISQSLISGNDNN